MSSRNVYFQIALDNLHFSAGWLCIFVWSSEEYAPKQDCSTMSTIASTSSVAIEYVDWDVGQVLVNIMTFKILEESGPPITKSSVPQTFPG